MNAHELQREEAQMLICFGDSGALQTTGIENWRIQISSSTIKSNKKRYVNSYKIR